MKNKRVRITGLAENVTHLRGHLEAGADVAEFAGLIRDLVGQVEAICRARAVTIDDLDAAAQRAYRYLTSLEVAPAAPDAAAPAPTAIRIANAVKTADMFAAMLSRRARTGGAADDLADVRGMLTQAVVSIARICAEAGATPAALPAPSRLAYGWMRFLLEGDHLDRHLAALRRADAASRASFPPSQQAVVELAPLARASFRSEPHAHGPLVRCAEGFIHADDESWRATFAWVAGDRSRRVGQALRAFETAAPFRDVQARIDTLSRE